MTVYTDRKPSPVERGIQTDKQEEKETGTQTEVSGASGLVNIGSDLHNDSGVCPGDIDPEAYDLMVKGKVMKLVQKFREMSHPPIAPDKVFFIQKYISEELLRRSIW